MWNINVNAIYYDNANFICKLVVIMRNFNNDAVLNKEERNEIM